MFRPPVIQEAGLYPHEELTREIIRGAFEVHNQLGYGFLEKIYEKALMYELNTMDIQCEQQKELPVLYKGVHLGTYFTDLIVDNKVLVEIKVNERLRHEHAPQVLNYLKATGLRTGLLINFGKYKVECRRFIMTGA